MTYTAEDSSCQIETNITYMAEPVVDVVSEHIQKEHISRDMSETAVKKCVSYKLSQTRPGRDKHKTTKRLNRVSKQPWHREKNQYINDYDCVIGVRRPPGPNIRSYW